MRSDKYVSCNMLLSGLTLRVSQGLRRLPRLLPTCAYSMPGTLSQASALLVCFFCAINKVTWGAESLTRKSKLLQLELCRRSVTLCFMQLWRFGPHR